MIKILCFASLRDAVGEASINIDQPTTTIGEIKAYIAKTYHVAACYHMMASINETYASDDALVQSGDTVALIPPVGGG